MATKEVDIILNLDSKQTGDGASQAVANLKRIQDQANKTRETMAKLAEVGSKMALVGGAIVAPFALSMKKYIDTAKESEPLSRRMVELSKKWEESQVRLGRITAEIVLPTLEKGAAVLENVIQFAEENPGVVKAALTIGGTMVILGGILATTAQLVSMVATIQGLAAAAGLASVGGGAVAGAAGAGAAALGGAAVGGGLAAAISFGITFAIPVLVGALALAIGSQIGLGLGNALGGTNKTMADIWQTAKELYAIVKFTWTQQIPRMFSEGLQSLGRMIGEALRAVVNSISAWFRGGRAAGGYTDRGRESVMNAATTSAAERAIGGRLTQGSAMSSVTNNFQVGNGMTISQTRQMVRASEQAVYGSLAGAFG